MVTKKVRTILCIEWNDIKFFYLHYLTKEVSPFSLQNLDYKDMYIIFSSRKQKEKQEAKERSQ